ncbi:MULTISPECIES: hypothetical protein [Bacillus cereus group]|uniref:hypothetical protein n=1 Tax=Bacillus cereus group TaxID=86661 RepID=UPI0022E46806|nr:MULTISPECIES: hypothetical protein [unclassified Bacillus cereus group]WAI29695.1 MAG: hypothetical protein NRZ50_28565 [Bacillus paranthracis]MDA2664502.1 hypothetical protein [Bacillus cereus group sp. Bc032]MDA2675251.1 hypothetical protein [Bacillus cereus group sp. Bc031]MDA2680669.1 hypothetical protein [Bacillus cereus group sp. Bc029]MDA2686189.1 hypothetical protein [Bacillus cereus group sp. Bc030]
MKLRKRVLLTCTSLMLALPSVASAANNNIPFFDGSENSLLKSDELQLKGKLLRPGSGYKSKEFDYKADLHFPAVYNGSFNWGNPWENLVQNEDTSDPYVRISNDGYINSAVVVGDRMVTEVEQVTKTVVKDKYWGQPDFVLTNMAKHKIIKFKGSNDSLGSFYWIRDIAYLSGGYAGAGGVNGVNRYSLWYVRTSKPQIKDFKATSGKKDIPVKFTFNGFEYVSKNKGYNDRDPNGTTINPYQKAAGERNRVKWMLDITKDGETVYHQENYLRSTPQKDNQKPNEGDAGQFKSEELKWQPQMCGRYTAKIKVLDAVQRESNEKKVDFTIDGNCGTEVTPNPNPGDEDDFKYKIDFSADRIEGETAREGKNIKTRVDVSRDNFKPERDQYRAKVNNNINKSQQEVNSSESERDSAQSSLSYCRRNPIHEVDAEGRDHYYDRDCSWEENKLDSAASKLDNARQKFEKEKNKLKKLDVLEEKYTNPETVVVLKHNGQQVSSQKVRLTEGEKKTLNLDWQHKGKGTIQAEINPASNRIDIEETTYKNNPIKTAIYEPSKEKAMCGVTSVKGVVETVSERVSKEDIVGKMYYETLTGSIDNLAPSKLHSGYGFSYEVNGKYKNEWNANYPGIFTAAKAQYPFADEGLKSTQDLEKNELKDNTAKFLPKNMYLSESTGHVFDSKRPTKSLYWDGQEKIIDGGQKWYSPLKTKDGVYTFNVETAPAGINEMSLCLTEQVEIKGVAYDDFIKRRVFPDDPFPGGSGVGWNWVGNEELLHKLTDWYYMKNGK